jgi:flagellar motor switch protein FliN/FliY
MAETEQAAEQKVEQAQPQAQAQSAEFPEANVSGAVGPGSSIDILLDMSVPVTVTIGKKEMPIRRLLQMGPGSVLRLDKPIEAPADLYLKDTKFATGTVVVVDGRFAIRIKEILGLGEPASENSEG